MPAYAAFISYSSRYRDWVATLQANLERCLPRHGESRRFFLDQTDLGHGRSWVTQLQNGLDQAESLVLVVTPEAMASPRVTNEWESLVAGDRHWQGRLQLALLVDAPLPSFLQPIQFVDFREHDEKKYRRVLAELLAGILGRTDRRKLPELTESVEIPEAPRLSLPVSLRQELVAWLAAILER